MPTLLLNSYSQKSSFLKCVKALKEANIQYSVDNSKRLQVSVDALRILDKEHSFLHDILPEKASGIFSVSPTPAYFLRKWLSLKCKHEIKYQTVKYEGKEKRRLRRFLSIKNDYFSEAALHKLNTIWGLRLFSFDVLIKLSNKTENSYNFDNSLYDFPKLKDGYFHFHFNANNSNGEGTPSIIMAKWQVDLLENICKKEFGENNFELNIDYNYIYDSRLFHEFVDDINSYEFFQDLKNIIDEESISQ